MKRLKESKLEINISNMLLFCSNPDLHLQMFLKKNNLQLLNENEIYDILYDVTVDSSDKLFDEAKTELNCLSFMRFVSDSTEEMKYYNAFNNKDHHYSILSRAKAVQTVHKLLFNPDHGKTDQLKEMQTMVNSDDEYITTSSRLLNSHIGGFTRKYVDVIIGKSGHGKSTWTDYNILHTILSGKVPKVIKIATEEPPEFSWRRITSAICHLSTTLMRQKLIKITDEHVKVITEKLQGRYKILHGSNKYKDVLEMVRTADAQQIYVDHIQSIDYPGSGGQLNNMIANIPGLVLFEEKIAQQKNISIVNLSQVGDKEIARSDRMSKRPRYHDAYGSSILYQKAREFLAVYYPYRDYEENPHSYYSGGGVPTINDFEIGIEKSSFSALSIVHMNFDYEYCTFTDKPAKAKTDYLAKSENEISMFET
ncbi:MAG: DnaB-like helicase C-terminal domain-containing protein [Patescibacteria group bacterium]